MTNLTFSSHLGNFYEKLLAMSGVISNKNQVEKTLESFMKGKEKPDLFFCCFYFCYLLEDDMFWKQNPNISTALANEFAL